MVEVADFMVRMGILIAALQKTKMVRRNPIVKSSSFNIIRRDRNRKAVDVLAFLIHDSVTYQSLTIDRNDPHHKVQRVAVRSGDVEIEFLNVYIPPMSACRAGYKPDIEFLLEGNSRVILDDFNTHCLLPT